jgi:CheY-like chemotaxis protein
VLTFSLSFVNDGQQAVDAVYSYIQLVVNQRLQSDTHSSAHSTSQSLVILMDGFCATRAIRSSAIIPAPYQPYIIALTANAMEGDKKMCIDAGINAYLSKPITIDALTHSFTERLPALKTDLSIRRDPRLDYKE